MSIIDLSNTINDLVDKALEAESVASDKAKEGKEKRLSPSIFNNCERKMWFAMNRSPKEGGFTGKILRRFVLGTDQEAGTVALLAKAGFKINTKNDKGWQHGVFSKGGKFMGFVDGIIEEAPLNGLITTPCLFEHKIMKSDKYAECKLKGLYAANIDYFDQVQLYMGSMNYKETLFVAYNTDTSELYAEVIKFNPEHYKALDEKTDRVIAAPDPKDLKKDTKWCKWCDFKKVCASYDIEF